MIVVFLMLATPVAGRGEGAHALLVSGLPPVTNTACLQGLSRIQANQGWPLRLEGVVTFVNPGEGLLVIQDSQGAAALHLDFDSTGIRPGQRIRVESELAACIASGFPEFPLKPSGSEWLPALSAPTNAGSYYLARLHGFLIPPTSGDYTFWIASKGSSELWFGTNTDPANLRRIAFIPAGKAVNPEQWNKFPTQCSGPIHLQAGQPCLLDLMHEQRAGRDDTVRVDWQGPGFAQSVIDGRFLTPYGNPDTNGIIREYWNDYFLGALPPLTSGETVDAELVVTAPRIQVLGSSPFPSPMPLKVGAVLTSAQNYRWAAMEGRVAFVGAGSNCLTLELVQAQAQAQAHTQLRLLGVVESNFTELVGARVRARGVCAATLDADGNHTAGVLWVPATNELEVIEPGIGDTPTLKAVSIGEISPTNPNLTPGRRIRVRGTVVHRDQGWVEVQGAARFCGYLSTNGGQWQAVAPPVDVPMHDLALAGLLACSANSGQLTTARFDTVIGVGSAARDREISDANPTGKTILQDGGVYVVQGGGSGFGPAFERLHFYCQPLATGNEFLARIAGLESPDPQSEAGIMVRDSIDAWSSFVSLTVRPGGPAIFRFRQSPNERDETIYLPGYSVPCGLKLTRSYPRIAARTDRVFTAGLGEVIDLTGILEWEGNQPVLAHARRWGEPAPNELQALGESLSATSLSVQSPRVHLAQLLPEPGERQREGSGSVCVRGVVTFSGQAFGANYWAFQDATAGALFRLNGRFSRRPLRVGELVELEVRSQNGRWPFPLDPNRVQVLGRAQMTEPASLSEANGLDLQGEGRWVAGKGVVQATSPGNGLTLRCEDGEIPVWVSGATSDDLNRYENALVQVRGVLIRRENGMAVLSPATDCVEILEPAPSPPFAIPAIAISDLKPFYRLAPVSHRVKITGVVTYRHENLLVLQDDSGGIRLQTATPAEVQAGDSVEVLGYPDGQSSAGSLAHPLVRKVGRNRLPAALPVSVADLYSDLDGARLVTLSGELVDQKTEGGNPVLEIQSGQRVFRAALLNSRERLPSMPTGSQVRITGLAWPDHFAGAAPGQNPLAPAVAAFEVLLRTPRDVVVLQWPPWWALKHATMVIGALGLVLGAAVLWIRHLRLKVARRTEELELAMAKLEREAKTSATLAERNRLAAEIHDGMEQGLSAIMMQLDGLEAKLQSDPTGAARHLEVARSMVRFSRTEVRHSLWDWKSPALAEHGLGGALAEIARQMSAGNQAQVAVQVSGPAVSLPATTEHHLLRIAQETLNNALKYAQASVIQLHLEYLGPTVRLSVRDNGRGFAPEDVLNGSGGHFGLQNLRSRARKVGGGLSITSTPGGGTLIEATVPVIAPVPKNGHLGQNSLS